MAKTTEVATKATVWLSRLVVGGAFTFSGLAKGIDPWGTFYKIQAYFGALGLPADMDALALTGALMLSGVEFLCGAMVLLGCYRRVAAWVASAIMAVMLPVSLWLAIANPVSDCGCFGDALVISNWGTFWKNVLLSAGCVWLLMRNRRVIPLIAPSLQWIACVASIVAILCTEWIGYRYQPPVDFRPFKVGTPLFGEEVTDGGSGFTFIYRKGDIVREFGEDDELPDESEGWEFVERRAKNNDTRAQSASHELRLWDEKGAEDLTEEEAPVQADAIVIVIPSLRGLSVAESWKLNELYDLAEGEGVDMVAVTSGTENDIADWRDLSLAEYPIYTSEDTLLKEVARGNPAVVYLRDGKILWKTTLKSIDGRRLDGRADEASEKELSSLYEDMGPWWKGIMGCYVSLLGVLIGLGLIFRRRWY